MTLECFLAAAVIYDKPPSPPHKREILQTRLPGVAVLERVGTRK